MVPLATIAVRMRHMMNDAWSILPAPDEWEDGGGKDGDEET